MDPNLYRDWREPKSRSWPIIIKALEVLIFFILASMCYGNAVRYQ